MLKSVLAFLIAAGPANTSNVGSAPPQPQNGAGDEIVVQGFRGSKQRATDYIDNVLPPMFDAQIGRFEDPLCPATVGLPDKLESEVMTRIGQVARAANIPLNARKCTPNLMIIIVDDKKALIEGMKKKKDTYLYGLGPGEVKKLENGPGPVAAWQITDVIGADGMPLRFDGSGFPRLFTTVPPSRITDTTRKRILAGMVVLEQRGLVNVTTRQLADYALVRLLAPIETKDRSAPDSSVLSLFNPGVDPTIAPQSVTWCDLAFLKALSSTRSDVVAHVQRHEIRDKMLSEMAKLRSQE
jgi:hypothetical protein